MANMQSTTPIVITQPPKPHEEPLPVDAEDVSMPEEDPGLDLIPDDELDVTVPFEPPAPGEGP